MLKAYYMITPEQMAQSGSESAHQKALFVWAQQYAIPELKWLFAVPNGGARDKITGARLRAEGVKPGLPDIGLMVARGNYQMLWIELKKPNVGKLSVAQSEWLSQASKCGHYSAVCYGWENARDVILRYLNGS